MISSPADRAFIADPYPVFAQLRDRHPVLHDESRNQWLISRHADVDRLLRDRRLGRTYRHLASDADFGRTASPAWHAPFHELNDAGMLDLEPPDHTRLRRLVSKAFTPRTVADMASPVQDIVDELVDRALDAGEFDVIADIAEPLPVTVIGELLDFQRPSRGHVAFGAGIHYCLGAPLARLELRTAFTTMLRRMPRLALVEPPEWKPTFVLRGLAALRVRC